MIKELEFWLRRITYKCFLYYIHLLLKIILLYFVVKFYYIRKKKWEDTKNIKSGNLGKYNKKNRKSENLRVLKNKKNINLEIWQFLYLQIQKLAWLHE